MGKLTTALIGVAVAIGLLAARGARKGAKQVALPSPEPDNAARTSGGSSVSGMAILRNDPIDNGIAVRSPFDGDPGIVPTQPSSNGQESDRSL
jgi:hypothetical protein